MKRSTKAAPRKKIDIREVALLARVSIATASRAINYIPTVNPGLAARVWKAANELNYMPNTQARALVSGKSKLFGLVVSDITNPFFPELIQQFEQIAVANGYEILIGSTNYERKTMEVCARRLLERKVDGIAIMTFGVEEFLLDRFEAERIPLVFINFGPVRERSKVLIVDYQTGIYQGVQHLAVLGHREIAFISGPLSLRSAEQRKECFINSLRAIGIAPNPAWLIEGDHTLKGGQNAMSKLLALKQWPTAIMCSNDLTAIGVQHCLFEADLKVPQDFSLIGFDDVHLAEYTIPPLTTVRMSCKDLAVAAVNGLILQINRDVDDAEPPAPATVPTSLIVRQTTGIPRNTLVDLKPIGDRKPSSRSSGVAPAKRTILTKRRARPEK